MTTATAIEMAALSLAMGLGFWLGQVLERKRWTAPLLREIGKASEFDALRPLVRLRTELLGEWNGKRWVREGRR